MKKLLLLMLGVLLALPAFAQEFAYAYEGQELKYTVTDEGNKTCAVSGFVTCEGALVIPSVAKNGDIEYTVTAVGDNAFKECYVLTELVIPNTVTTIGKYAFRRCLKLKNVDLGDSVTSIGSSAFGSCEGLAEVVIPSSVTSIGSSAFSFCESLAKVVIPSSVTSIGN